MYKEYYFPYHLHTKKSVRDGVNNAKDLIQKVDSLGYNKFITTDHDNITSIYDNFKYCEGTNIQAGIGCEFYLSLDINKEKYHITTIVLNDIGYYNMLKLMYISNNKDYIKDLDEQGSFYKVAKILPNTLFNFSEGLAVSSGCRLSLFNKLFINNEDEKAIEYLNWFKSNIKHFLIELHVANSEVEELMFYKLKKYSISNNLPTIIGNDVHYLDKGDLIKWSILNAIRHKTKINNDSGIKNDDFYIKSYDEIFQDTLRINKKYFVSDNIIRDTEQLFYGFKYLSDHITFNWFDNWNNRKLPKITFNNADELISEILYKRLNERFPNNKLYRDRLKVELETCIKTDNASYFYFVHLFVEDCKRENIMLNRGRGSASSLLISYLLDITKVDPLKFNFIFERAMNPDRPKLMDIDIDISKSDKQKAVKLLQQRFGEDKVCYICTYSYMGIKQALQNVGSFLNIPSFEIDSISKNTQTIEDLKANNFIKNFNKTYVMDNNNITITGSNIINYVEGITGCLNSIGTHAGGILVMSEPVYNHIPVKLVNGVLCSAYDMDILEKLGGLKLDLLIIDCYDLIKNGLNSLKESNLLINNSNKDLRDDIDYNCMKTLNFLATGNNSTDTFQLNSEDSRKMLSELIPIYINKHTINEVNTISLLSDISALIRPACLANKSYTKYKNRFNGIKIPYSINEKSVFFNIYYEATKNTYFEMLYQEQFMIILSKLFDVTYGIADLYRRYFEKNDIKELDKLKYIFWNKWKNKASVEECKEIWSYLSGDYGFNASHAYSYAYNTYDTAYIKSQSPEIFYSEAIEINFNKTDKIHNYIKDCENLGINVKMPKLFNTYKKCHADIENKTIYLPLKIIKNIGVQTSNVLSNLNSNKNMNLNEFMLYCSENSIDNQELNILYQIDYLDVFGLSKSELREQINKGIIWEEYKEKKFIKKTNSYIYKCSKTKDYHEEIISDYNLFDLNIYIPENQCKVRCYSKRYNIDSEITSAHILYNYHIQNKYIGYSFIPLNKIYKCDNNQEIIIVDSVKNLTKNNYKFSIITSNENQSFFYSGHISINKNTIIKINLKSNNIKSIELYEIIDYYNL